MKSCDQITMGLLSSNSYHICQDFGHPETVRLRCYVSGQQVVREALARVAADGRCCLQWGEKRTLESKSELVDIKFVSLYNCVV